MSACGRLGPARSPLRHHGVHGGAGAVKLLQGTLGGVLRPGAESHVCFMVPRHRRLFPRQARFHEPGPAPHRNKAFRSSLPSRLARLLIRLHLNATRRSQLHRQAQHPGSPANPSLRVHPPPNRPASPGSGMPAGPQVWRRWRRGTPRNAKPNCTNDPKGYGHRTPPPSAPAPAAAEQRHAPANSTTKLFSCARMTRTAPTRSPQPYNSCPRRTTPTRPSDRYRSSSSRGEQLRTRATH
jgi:hypothetical protein